MKSIALSESQGESAVIVGIATVRYETPDGCLLVYDLQNRGAKSALSLFCSLLQRVVTRLNLKCEIY